MDYCLNKFQRERQIIKLWTPQIKTTEIKKKKNQSINKSMKKNSCFTNRIIPRILTYSLDPLLSVVTVSSILARILTLSEMEKYLASWWNWPTPKADNFTQLHPIGTTCKVYNIPIDKTETCPLSYTFESKLSGKCIQTTAQTESVLARGANFVRVIDRRFLAIATGVISLE